MGIKRKKARLVGRFNIQEERSIFGELTISGSKTALQLHDSDFFAIHDIPDRTITGVLHDLTKITLLNCISSKVPGSSSGPKGQYYFAKMFPHFIVTGNHHISAKEATITEAIIYVDDAKLIFNDFDAFGAVFSGAQPLVEEIMSKESHRGERKTGPNARILYYAGKDEIVSAETRLGNVSVEHRPRLRADHGEGNLLRDEVAVSIRFDPPLSFLDTIDRVARITEYLGLLAGRPQNLSDLFIRTTEENSLGELLKVDWTMYEKRHSGASNEPSSHDVLIDGVRQPNQFASVLQAWLKKDETWHHARWRFFNSFAKERHYDIDRLVASANMFDLLPSSVAPTDNPLPPDVEAARSECRSRFRALPNSPERSSVLEALGRIGKSSLKRRVRHRAQTILDQEGERFPDLIRVIDEAVNCRNYYVHGSEGTFNYDQHFDSVVFFTDTLEFIFAVSDMIDAGWDFKDWIARGSTMSHPFGRYKVAYRENLRTLIPWLSQ